MENKILSTKNSETQLEIIFNKEEIEKAKDKVIAKLASKTKMAGFREGKAPPKLVEEQVDKNLLESEVLNELLTSAFSAIIQEHKFKPVGRPRFEIKKWEALDNLELILKIVEKPEVVIGEFAKDLKKLYKEKKDELNATDIIDTILEKSKVHIPELLIEDDVARILSDLADKLTSLGIDIQTYLESKNLTHATLKKQEAEASAKRLKIELMLSELVHKFDLKATKDEISNLIKANPDENTRKQLEKDENRWYLESVITKQKLMEKLMDMAKGNDKEQ